MEIADSQVHCGTYMCVEDFHQKLTRNYHIFSFLI